MRARWLPIAAMIAALAGCAPASGWQRTDVRACRRSSPARVCADDDPDRPIEIGVGGATILPGECAEAPQRGGLVRVRTARDGTSQTRWVAARRGAVTRIGTGRPTRRACDGGVAP